MRFVLIALTAFAFVKCQRKEGDICKDEILNSNGICTPLDKCPSAKVNFQQNGIRPTFCMYNVFGNVLVCCSEGSSKPQGADTLQDDSTHSKDKRKVCELKCEEYNRGLVSQTTSASKCDYNGEKLIGGENARRGDFPHLAAIGWSSSNGDYLFYCSGSLISHKFVLTAGHCLQLSHNSVTDSAPVIVRLGDQNIDPSINDGVNSIEVPIRKAYKHPSYKPPSTYDDIALLELTSEITFNDAIRPACLWTRQDFGTHTMAVATGGVTDTFNRSPKPSKELQKVPLSLIENNYCETLLKPISSVNWAGLRDTQMCAMDLRGEKNNYQGDSGSPLQVVSKDNQCIFYVVGVKSLGKQHAEDGRPAVYTRVAAYVPWIESVVWPGE